MRDLWNNWSKDDRWAAVLIALIVGALVLAFAVAGAVAGSRESLSNVSLRLG